MLCLLCNRGRSNVQSNFLFVLCQNIIPSDLDSIYALYVRCKLLLTKLRPKIFMHSERLHIDPICWIGFSFSSPLQNRLATAPTAVFWSAVPLLIPKSKSTGWCCWKSVLHFLGILCGIARSRARKTSRHYVLKNVSSVAGSVCLCRDGIELGSPQK